MSADRQILIKESVKQTGHRSRHRNFISFNFVGKSLWMPTLKAFGKEPALPVLCNHDRMAAIVYPFLILHSDFHRGGLQFRRISTVAQKCFDALPCFSHYFHATLSIKCKYISFYSDVPCLNAKLTNYMQNFTFC